MKRFQAFKFELRPTGKQVLQMRRFAGSCRFVYNRALALQKAQHEVGKKKLSYAALCKNLTEWKTQEDSSWLTEAPAQALQQSLKDLERAYKNFFEKRAAFPNFKKKGLSDSFRYPQGYNLEQGNTRIFLPKLGWLRYRKSRDVLGIVKNVTVSHVNGKWYISIQTEREIADPVHPASGMVGIDMGITRFATMSDGTVIRPLNSFKKLEKKLARAQRGLARKKKFSANWKRQKATIQQIHHKIANARNDFLHKVSTKISKNHAVIVVEDLNVKGMSKSAKGDVKKPGRNVRAKSGLNKSILDQGWRNFRRMLEYKQQWQGGEVLAINPAYTSRTCSVCGHEEAANRKSQARFKCLACDHTAQADLNAAHNILAAGHAVLACGGEALVPPVKQEPTEVTQAHAA